MDWRQYIHSDPKILLGKPVVKALEEIAIDWLDAHGIPYKRDKIPEIRVTHSESALHSNRRVDVQAGVELSPIIYGICMYMESGNEVGSGVDYRGKLTRFAVSFG